MISLLFVCLSVWYLQIQRFASILVGLVCLYVDHVQLTFLLTSSNHPGRGRDKLEAYCLKISRSKRQRHKLSIIIRLTT